MPYGKQSRKTERLRCYDCRYQVRTKLREEPSTADEIASQDRVETAGVGNHVKAPTPTPRLSAQDFAARLRQSGILQDAKTADDLDEKTAAHANGDLSAVG